MARLNTGGKSVRVDVVLSPELYAAVEKAAEARDVKVSELARQALAAFIGRPELAGELKPGRRWPAKKPAKKAKAAPAKKRK